MRRVSGGELDNLVIDTFELRIFGCAAHEDAQIGDLVQCEGGWRGGCGHGDEVGAVHLFEVKAGALVGRSGLNLDVAHLEVGDVAQEEALRGRGGAEHAWVRILVGIFRHDDFGVVGRAAALMLDVNVRDLDVLNGVVGDAAEDGGDVRGGVVTDKIVDDDALEGADLCALLGAAQARSETPEERGADDVAHGDVGDGDVFTKCSVFAFESEAHAAFEDAVGDGDVFEAAVGFGAALDAAVAGETGNVGSEFLVGAVEHGAELVGAGDKAVGDGHVLGGWRVIERIAGLGADSVVPGRVDEAVGDADVAAAVDVHAVA